MRSLPSVQIGRLGRMGIHQQRCSITAMSPALWLDAADPFSIVETEGKVSQWKDKSGKGNHAIQEIESHQPIIDNINGRPAVFSDTLIKYLNIPHINGLYSGHSVFIAFEIDSIYLDGTYQFLTAFNGQSTSDGRQPLFYYRSDLNRFEMWEGNNAEPFGQYTMDTPAVVFGRYNGDTLEFELVVDDGTQIVKSRSKSSALTEGSAAGTIFNSTASGVKIGEIIAFDRALTTMEANRIGRYLKQKWNMSWADIN